MSSIGDYIYTKLTADSSVTDLVSNRIYPQVIPQDIDRPSVVYNTISTVPTNTKSGVSTLDQVRIEIAILANTSNSYNGQQKADEIAEAVRSCLDFTQNETLAGNTIQRISFQSDYAAFDPNAGQDGVYIVYQNYYFWKQR